MSCHDTPSRLEPKSEYPIFSPQGPKNGQKGPFGATDAKNRFNGYNGIEMTIILPTGSFCLRLQMAQIQYVF